MSDYTYTERAIHTGEPEYDSTFWNVMRGREQCADKLMMGWNSGAGAYSLPNFANGKFTAVLEKESLFRRIATTIYAYKHGYKILAKDCNELSMWVPEGGAIPIYEGITDFTQYPVDSWKLAAFLKLDEEFVQDNSFDIEHYLVQRLARNFGRAEEQAFISGTGVEMPVGILHDTKGAKTAVTTNALSFEDVTKLYFSVKPEYRAKGVWLMNDETALYLRNLKDDTGNFLWRGSAETLLGKPVVISNYMPSATTGEKPIAFGDFSYYWVICRKPVSVRTIIEKFAEYEQIGYLAFEFLDGRLIRPEAVKLLQMAEETPLSAE